MVAKRVLVALGLVVVAIALIVGGYVAYLAITYNRIADNEPIQVENDVADTILQPGKDYTASTYNIGFGAYTPDYSFFMDEGIMEDGTETQGERSLAASRESVAACTEGAISVIDSLSPDFALFQEVDTDSTRSFGINQAEAIRSAFPSMGSAYTVNFHTAFLPFPPSEPHGIVNSGLLTLSNAHVSSAIRRSYPVDDSFPTKFFDLDRCFAVERIPVENGRDLVLVNNHMSAYDEGGKIRTQQFNLLMATLEQEIAAGNYVIAGGDWNHALCGSEAMYPSAQLVPPWLAVFDESALPEGMSVVRADNITEVATCRGADIPYEPGITFTTTVDGFLVSSNVDAHAQNIETSYAYSDHNPVFLTFRLKDA